MDALQKNVANIQGQAIAATLLASAALQTVLAMVQNKDQMLDSMAAFIDETLNRGGPATGDAHDEFNTLVREKARFHADQTLDAIRHGLRNPPKA
jgi:hypothetical protein